MSNISFIFWAMELQEKMLLRFTGQEVVTGQESFQNTYLCSIKEAEEENVFDVHGNRIGSSVLAKEKNWQWCHRLKALLIKNFIRMWRNLGFLTFQCNFILIHAVQGTPYQSIVF